MARAGSEAAALRRELAAHPGALRQINEALLGLRSPLSGTIGGLREMAEIAGVAFVFDKAFESVKHMAELGENTVNTAASVGLSVEVYSQLDRQLGLVGKSGDTAARSLIILQTKIEEAVNKPESKARASFDAFGISPAELKEWASSSDGAMLALKGLADAQQHFADGINKTTAERNLLGRSMRELIPWLKEHEELERRIAANKSAFTAPEAEKWANLNKEFKTLNDAAFGLEKSLTQGLVDPLTTATVQATELVRKMTELGEKASPWAVVGGAAAGGAAGAGVGALAGTAVAGPIGGVVGGVVGFGVGATGGAVAGGVASGALNAPTADGRQPDGSVIARVAPFPALGNDVRGADIRSLPWKSEAATREEREATHGPGAPSGPGGGHGEGANLPQMGPVIDWAERTKDLEKEIKSIAQADTARQAWLDFEITAAKGDQEAIRLIAKQKIDLAQEARAQKHGVNAAADPRIRRPEEGYDTEGIRLLDQSLKEENKFEEAQAKAAIKLDEAHRKTADQQETLELQQVERLRSLGDITVDDAAAQELQIIRNHKTKVDAIIADEERQAAKSIELAGTVKARQEELDAKYVIDQQRITDKASAEHEKAAKAIDKEIAGAASRGLVDLAWGKTTPGQAVASTAQSLETKALDKVFEKLLDASGVGKLFDRLSESALNFLTEQLTLGTSTVTTAGEIAALGTAAAATATQMGGSSAASGAGGLLGKLPFGQLLGGGGAAAGAADFGAVEVVDALPLAFLGGGGIIPSAAGGMINDGKGGRMIIAHPNEMVLPSYLSQGVQNMIAAGGGAAGGTGAGEPHFHYAPNINAPESPDLKQLLSRHGNDMLYWLQAQRRSGALPA